MSLRAAFKRIDTNGNGVIEQHELRDAILASGQVESDEATAQTVDNMIEWACTKTPNGDIDFEEYTKIMRVKLPCRTVLTVAVLAVPRAQGFVPGPFYTLQGDTLSRWRHGLSRLSFCGVRSKRRYFKDQAYGPAYFEDKQPAAAAQTETFRTGGGTILYKRTPDSDTILMGPPPQSTVEAAATAGAAAAAGRGAGYYSAAATTV